MSEVFWNLKANTKWHKFSSKLLPTMTLQTASTGDHISNTPDLWLISHSNHHNILLAIVCFPCSHYCLKGFFLFLFLWHVVYMCMYVQWIWVMCVLESGGWRRLRAFLYYSLPHSFMTVSQCNGSSRLAGQKDPRYSCLHPVPGAGVTGVFSHGRLFIWVLHISNLFLVND